ncbi:hypothetical protein Q765_06720 [Flavobacterium rivuli WB 3.3-2 = DSM 21788]|uniref:Uncharacterized protein n=1 Tax=Flavobacterium rivuli WB 3.3-2 = DSM 21788 TaxID=1121895 RepID=A0A0A2M7B0_9FLAO|nr:hypothetical protein [Flavobacterium rivuli]KGO87353.1 hypothetical protein Q765_06720 [Flavobacterium rivuli WB 3.3-2 = DSM 21788]
MKLFYTILLVLFCFAIKAQSIVILNAVTKEPVPFATVLARLNQEPVSRDYCNQDGSVKISIKNYDVLEVSCIGFTAVALDKAAVGAEVLLQPVAFQLDEVVITGRTNVVTVGYIDRKKNDFSGIAAEFKDAVFIPNTTGNAGYIKSFLFKIVKAKNRFAYRLHFYKRATGKSYPGEEVTPANIIGFVEKDTKGLTELDLTEYTIEFPETGIFVSIEGLGACDGNGKIIEAKDAYITYEDFQSAEPIYFHQPEFFISTGWINQNERIIRDYKENGNSKPPVEALRVPSFGLKVYR